MKILIIAPVLPPQLDGIGDHTALLGAHLAQSRRVSEVVVLTGTGVAHDPIEGGRIVPAFSPEEPKSVWKIVDHVAAERPDCIVLQYNPFAYGKWGLNLSLPRVMRAIRREMPSTNIAVIAHECYVPPVNWKFAVMGAWQRPQFRGIGKTADSIFFSIEPWLDAHRDWFGDQKLVHLPVGSNVPRIVISRAKARRLLHIDDGAAVLGIFGTAHPARLFSYVRSAAEAARDAGRKVVCLYIGPHADAVRSEMGDIPVIAKGALSADDVSRQLAAVDVYLTPFIDGISTRRGALMAALQHGLPIVATRGKNTGELLRAAHGTAYLLSDVGDVASFNANVLRLLDDENLKCRLGREAEALYERHFGWDVLAGKLLRHLPRVGPEVARVLTA